MSLSTNVIKGSAILLLSKLVIRGIGILSMLVLARLLTPQDFGIVSIATLVVFFFESLTNMGAREYIIYKSLLNADDLNTAWTLNIISKCAIWIVFLTLIPIISKYYSIAGLEMALIAISLILPISSFENIGTIIYQKELNYKPLFFISLAQKTGAFIFTLAIALWFKNYWAMIIGTIISYLTLVISSYAAHSYRPSFSLKKIQEQWAFSKWMIPKGIVGFSKAEFDTFIVSKAFDISSLGGFNIMKSLTGMIGRDVITPATDPLLPSFSKVKHDAERLRFQASLSLLVIVTLSIPAAVFMAIYHHEITLLLLGEKWDRYSPVLASLSILIVSFSIGGILQHILTSQGKIKTQFYFEVLGFTLTAVTLISINFDSLTTFSLARSFLALTTVLLMLIYTAKTINLSIITLVTLALPALTSAALSATLVSTLHPGEGFNTIIYIIMSGGSFIMSYLLLLLAALYLLKDKEEVKYLKMLTGNLLKKITRKSSVKT